MFSLNRLYANAILTNGKIIHSGVRCKPGHSDAVRRIKGVKDAKQYNSVEAALEAVRNGKSGSYNKTETYKRMLCSCRGRCGSGTD